MAEMTVQRALNELKIIDERLSKRLTEFVVVGTKKASEARVVETRESIVEFENRAKGVLDSVDGLLKRQQELKHAIMTSNATTMIEVVGKTYSVMTAIDRKRTIEKEKLVVKYMRDALIRAEYKVSQENDKMESYIQRQTNAMAGGDLSSKKDDYIIAFEKSYREQNSWDLVDPLKLRDLIEQREQEISMFELEIDTALTVSNAITKIEIED